MTAAQRRRVRLGMGLATAALLAAEVWIGLFAGGWVRAYFGDVLVVILLYTLCRTVSPGRPRFGAALPLGLLAFAFAVELLQAWGFVDRFHITSPLLRTIIGTSFAWGDLLAYAAGTLPGLLCELLLKVSPMD